MFTNANLFSQESDLLGCVRENNIQGAKEMIEAGGDVNQEDELTGHTPLTLAILMGDKEELVSFLINNGADVNTTAKNGKTPLNLAIEAGNDNFVELLEANGAK